MFQEPIVRDRVRTALEEGITSQSVAKARRDHSAGDSFLRGLLRSISSLWNKVPVQTREIKKSYGYPQAKETVK